jgi:hypothetical protein
MRVAKQVAISVARLSADYGADMKLPDLRHKLAQCPRREDMRDPCEVEYPELRQT